jgi:hypothetical protein
MTMMASCRRQKKRKVTTMLKVKLQQDDDDFVLWLDGDVDYYSTAMQALVAVVPPEALSASDGLLRVRGFAGDYLDAWLKAVEITHRATITWLPIVANA